MRHRSIVLLFSLMLLGCEPAPPELLGTLEWDRITLPAELSERITAEHVKEGAQVAAGDLLLELDPRRQDARIAQAQGELSQNRAKLAELVKGARVENIQAAEATLEQSQASKLEADRNYARLATLYSRKQIALAELDKARAARDEAQAATRNARANLEELTNGTRIEQIQQAQAAQASSEGKLRELQLAREHLSLQAPRAGRIDALPYKTGDQPPAGAQLVVMLVGDAPYARLFIPASLRTQLAIGDELQVTVQGSSTSYTGNVRSISSDPSFTPYYALTGEDASRLMYRAEVVLQGVEAAELPAGLPVTARLPEHE
ncbi:HlyD family efflux transporter periplasmic adaptor subunit [Pseudomonas sp.]|uniref:HlyD family secretion protein n=1 Tax=Pseudomonas sp. TaxID=306 RepID=UPI002580E015|nr:HlyD family efflux transporter periplasmic adaptor subunit [Pseudomonas sp.]